MYRDYFGLKELPFSIAPDPRYLYMSERHKEALAHLLYGVSGQGGFVVLTGEVGTGKTTICRCFLQQVPENTDVAFIVNPKLSARELLANICDEFGIEYPLNSSIKIYNDLISRYLLQAHSEGHHTVLVIDEAQNLRVDVLEQLRLLTNLETSEKKLLQIILLGQPELQDILAKQELRQLAQRITARYHLKALSKEEVQAYVRYRLGVAGQKQMLFKPGAINMVYKKSGGIPRLINLICDRALLGAYSQSDSEVNAVNIKGAYKEIKGEDKKTRFFTPPKWVFTGVGAGLTFGVLLILLLSGLGLTNKTTFETNSVARYADEVAASVSADTSAHIEEVERHSVSSEAVDPALRYGRKYVSSLEYTPPPFNSKLFAYSSILRAWGIIYTREKHKFICEFAELKGLRCLHKQGNWRSLLKINRPVVLTLSNNKGQEFFVGLLALEGDYAKISLGQKTIWTSLDAIDQQWYGDYSVIWQLPPYESRVIKPGLESDPDKWLNSNLLKVKMSQTKTSENSGRIERGESTSTKDNVIWFQQEVGLKPDGIAGALTLIHLNNFINPNVPVLLRETNLTESPKS
jgi:general secretion pathway protein A